MYLFIQKMRETRTTTRDDTNANAATVQGRNTNQMQICLPYSDIATMRENYLLLRGLF